MQIQLFKCGPVYPVNPFINTATPRLDIGSLILCSTMAYMASANLSYV